MKPPVARWLEFAEIDLKAARALLKEGSLSPVVCFHAQQRAVDPIVWTA